MPREGLPFKTTGEPKSLSRGTVSDVFEFTPEKGREYVYKEVRPDSRAFRLYHGKDLGETAALMSVACQILGRHLGDYLVPTHFLLAKNKEGKSCIMMAQEKIRGKRVRELNREGLSPDIQRQVNEIGKLSSEAGRDLELVELVEVGKLGSSGAAEYFFSDAGYQKNLIVDESGRVRVVDW